MGRNGELLQLARDALAGLVSPEDAAGRLQSREEAREFLFFLRLVSMEERERKMKRGRSQRRALKLLYSLIGAESRAQVSRSKYFIVVAKSGSTYRLWPHAGMTERVEPHGTKLFGVESYCYHDEGGELPRADVTIAHFLELVTDEEGFLSRANATRHSPWAAAARLRRAARAAAA